MKNCLYKSNKHNVIAARIKKIRFLYWTMDLQPELSIISGYVKNKSISAKLLLKQGDYIFKKADLIVTLDKYMLEYIYRRVERSKDVFNIIIICKWFYTIKICSLFAYDYKKFAVFFNVLLLLRT